MALKARINAEIHATLADAIKAEYKQDGDDFVIDVVPVDGWALEDVGGLKSTLQKLKTTAKTTETALKQFEVDGQLPDPSTVKGLLEKFKKLGDLSPEQLADQKVKAALEQQQLQFNTQLTSKEKREKALMSNLEKVLISDAATAALASRKGNVKLLLPHVKNSLRVVEEEGEFHVRVHDGKGNDRISVRKGQTGDMTLEELIEEMASSDDFASAFESSTKAGGGSTKPSGNGAPAPVRRVSAEELGNSSLADIAAGRVTLAG